MGCGESFDLFFGIGEEQRSDTGPNSLFNQEKITYRCSSSRLDLDELNSIQISAGSQPVSGRNRRIASVHRQTFPPISEKIRSSIKNKDPIRRLSRESSKNDEKQYDVQVQETISNRSISNSAARTQRLFPSKFNGRTSAKGLQRLERTRNISLTTSTAPVRFPSISVAHSITLKLSTSRSIRSIDVKRHEILLQRRRDKSLNRSLSSSPRCVNVHFRSRCLRH